MIIVGDPDYPRTEFALANSPMKLTFDAERRLADALNGLRQRISEVAGFWISMLPHEPRENLTGLWEEWLSELETRILRIEELLAASGVADLEAAQLPRRVLVSIPPQLASAFRTLLRFREASPAELARAVDDLRCVYEASQSAITAFESITNISRLCDRLPPAIEASLVGILDRLFAELITARASTSPRPETPAASFGYNP